VSPAWITALVALIAAVASLAAWGLRSAWRILRQTAHFLDDWRGEPQRDGLAAKPGVMARLQDLTDDVATVRAQVFPNAGTSLRDAVDKVAADLKAHREATSPAIRQLTADVADMRGQMELFETQRAARENP
jgi:hypothetical protein